MRLIPDTHFNFMRWKWLAVGLSTAVNILSLILCLTVGIKQGVEFTGGAAITLRFREAPSLEDVRSKLKAAGLDAAVTEFGNTGGKELSIRVGLKGDERASDKDVAHRVINALLPPDAKQKLDQKLIDLNLVDRVALGEALQTEAHLEPVAAEAAAGVISDYRRDHGGVFQSLDEAKALPQVPEAARGWLQQRTFAGPFGLRGQDIIEASISKELRSKALYATLGAMGGMLVYIWFRFHFQWGLGAIVALVHDVVFTLGCFVLFGFEADLPVVAAFLTLVGYSVNDTVVVFDRIRENLRTRGETNFEQVINDSINQTLSRTLITSFTAWICCVSLFIFAGPVLRSFSFVMMVGILIGTYSSIYIASPILVVWKQFFDKRSETKAAALKAAKQAAKVDGGKRARA